LSAPSISSLSSLYLSFMFLIALLW
jgi:hypothetical protein